MRSDGRPEGPGGRTGSSWPTSAFVVTALLGGLVLILVMLNVLGLRLFSGRYDPAASGTAADWFSGIATLIAIPFGFFIAARQLQHQRTERDEQIVRQESELEERRSTSKAVAKAAIDLDVVISNVIDAGLAGSGADRERVKRWTREKSAEGWKQIGEGLWMRDGGDRATTADLLGSPSALLREPWYLAIDISSCADLPATVCNWRSDTDGLAPDPAHLSLHSQERALVPLCHEQEPVRFATAADAEATRDALRLHADVILPGHPTVTVDWPPNAEGDPT